MKFKTIRTIYVVCTLLELALFAVAYLTLDASAKYWGVAGLIVLTFNTAFSFKYARCPHCGSHLNRVVFINCCPYCGEGLDEPPKGGNFD